MRMTLLLALLCLALSGILAYEIRHPPPLTIPEVPARADLPALPALDFALPPLEHYREIVERPLFFPDRRPPPKGAPAVQPPRRPPGRLAAALMGIVITPEKRQALIKDLKTQKILRLEEGMRIQGWEVVRIEPERVVLKQSGGEEALILYRFEPPPAARPKAPPRRRPLKRPGRGLQ